MRRRSAKVMSVITAVMMAGCGLRSISPATQADFGKVLENGGYGSLDDGYTTDSEDGSTAIVPAKNGWVAGFYVCADNEVAENEFYNECNTAGLDDFKDGDNYTIAEKETGEKYLRYIVVDNTCLFMEGSTENEEEMKRFAKELGYDVQ